MKEDILKRFKTNCLIYLFFGALLSFDFSFIYHIFNELNIFSWLTFLTTISYIDLLTIKIKINCLNLKNHRIKLANLALDSILTVLFSFIISILIETFKQGDKLILEENYSNIWIPIFLIIIIMAYFVPSYWFIHLLGTMDFNQFINDKIQELEITKNKNKPINNFKLKIINVRLKLIRPIFHASALTIICISAYFTFHEYNTFKIKTEILKACNTNKDNPREIICKNLKYHIKLISE